MKNVRRNFLNLPNYFEAKNITKGTETPSGIIKRIRNEVNDIKSYVYPSYNGEFGDGSIDTLVNWNGIAEVYNSGAYFQLDFKHGYVFPTSYSIRGYSDIYSYATEWILYGFNTPEEEMTIIGENKSEGTTFCDSGQQYCKSDNWATFSVKPVKKAFKYFRMIPKVSTSAYGNLFLAGIIYFCVYSIDGKILINGKLKRNTCFCKKCSNFPFYFVLMVTIYSR